MRKFFVFNVFLFVGIVLFAQNIPNNSFETWVTAAEGHEDPEYWGTANSTTNVFPMFIVTTEKTADAYDGSFAAMLTSKAVLTFTAPGFITLGDFDIDLFTQVTSITGGEPFTLRPTKLNLYYKFFPAEGDSFRIGMWMLREEGFEVPDTVGTALYNDVVGEQAEYTYLSLDVEYRNEFNPEIINVIAVSSNPDNPVEGSVLYVDKFELEYATGIIDDEKSKLEVYPNPSSQYIYVSEYFCGSDVSVYDIKGSELIKIDNISNIGISVKDLPEGTYLLSIMKGGIMHTQRFVKQ